MERAIGEVFEFEGKNLKVVEYKGCGGCYFEFYEYCGKKKEMAGICSHETREDKKSVIFKLLEE